MNNKSMIEYKEGLISKIKNFFKKLFKRKKEKSVYEPEKEDLKENEIITDKEENEFFNDI